MITVQPDSIEKATAFITRRTTSGDGLLLFEHPPAGIQIPAGMVEVGEIIDRIDFHLVDILTCFAYH